MTDPADPIIQAAWPHRIRWTRHAFSTTNRTLAEAIRNAPVAHEQKEPHPQVHDEHEDDANRLLIAIEEGVQKANPQLVEQAKAYLQAHGLPTPITTMTFPGGEAVKNGMTHVHRLLDAIQTHGIDRRSYVLAIGGGALLDMAGFAASIAHRGVRLVRMPTTTLSQCDSGVGVKNAVNFNDEKNFIGCFQVPWAVVNDTALLSSLPEATWREGLAEAVKVALLKDANFFGQIESQASTLEDPTAESALNIWRRCAELHTQHIAEGGDPFEEQRARPLDFGHWSAHRLEQLSKHTLSHGQAVAIGLVIDTRYAAAVGLLPDAVRLRVEQLLRTLGLPVWHESARDTESLLGGIERFRQHLGGRLTLTLLRGIGHPVDVHTIDTEAMRRVLSQLQPAPASAV